jgi:hypothetical protein
MITVVEIFRRNDLILLFGRIYKKIKYRIIEDSYNGFKAQIWCWWCPFWIDLVEYAGQIGVTYSWPSIEKAENLIKEVINKKQKIDKPIKNKALPQSPPKPQIHLDVSFVDYIKKLKI